MENFYKVFLINAVPTYDNGLMQFLNTFLMKFITLKFKFTFFIFTTLFYLLFRWIFWKTFFGLFLLFLHLFSAPQLSLLLSAFELTGEQYCLWLLTKFWGHTHTHIHTESVLRVHHVSTVLFLLLSCV
mgnify:CR=1 FL=1